METRTISGFILLGLPGIYAERSRNHVNVHPGATYAEANQVERASSGSGLLGSTTGYTRDPAGALVGIRGASRSYYLFDGLGSVVAVTNPTVGSRTPTPMVPSA